VETGVYNRNNRSENQFLPSVVINFEIISRNLSSFRLSDSVGIREGGIFPLLLAREMIADTGCGAVIVELLKCY